MEAGMSEGIFGLAGVVLGLLFQWVQQAWTQRRERAANARYLAIRVVCALDKYIEDCLAVTFDDGYSEGRPAGKDGYAEAQVTTPVAPIFPSDADWKSINHELMYRLLALPRDVEIADHAIDAAGEHDTPPDYCDFFEERQYQYAKLGLSAFDITKDIRRIYAIPPLPAAQWSAADRLAEQLKKIEDGRREYGERQKQLWAEFPPPPAPGALGS